MIHFSGLAEVRGRQMSESQGTPGPPTHCCAGQEVCLKHLFSIIQLSLDLTRNSKLTVGAVCRSFSGFSAAGLGSKCWSCAHKRRHAWTHVLGNPRLGVVHVRLDHQAIRHWIISVKLLVNRRSKLNPNMLCNDSLLMSSTRLGFKRSG